MKVMCLCALASTRAFAQGPTPHDLAREVPLPPAYSGRAVETVFVGSEPGEIANTFEFEFAIAQDWTVGTQYRLDAEFGRSPIVYEHATPNESYWYSFGRGAYVSRNSRFRETGMMAIEQRVSPLPIVRVLQSARMEDIKWSVRQEGDMTILELHFGQSPAKQRLFFESVSHRLVQAQTLSPAGGVAAETRFEDWTPIGDGYEVPMSVVKILNEPGTRTELRATLSDLKILLTADPPARKRIPADATIDNFETGVTTTPDGTVLGKIERIPSPSRAVSRSRGWLSLDARTFMFAGVVLLLGSGVILGWRRWKTA